MSDERTLELACRQVTAKMARKVMRKCGYGDRPFPKRGHILSIDKKVAADLEIVSIINYKPGDYVMFTRQPVWLNPRPCLLSPQWESIDTFTPWINEKE